MVLKLQMFNFKRAIETGSYGQVSVVEKDENLFAVKEFIISGKRKNIYGAIYLKEVDFLKRCDHPNILKVIDITYSCPYDNGVKIYKEGMPDNIFAIMNLAEMSCSDFIAVDENGKIDETTHSVSVPMIKRFMYQISNALGYLHANGICNRDIKTSNVLIFKDETYSDAYNAVLCDLGMCKSMICNIDHSDHIGTSSYKSPEVLLGYEKYDFPIDIWSLGILFFELFNLNRPFERQRSTIAKERGAIENAEIITKIFRNRGSPTQKVFNKMTRSHSIVDFSKINKWSKKPITDLFNKKSQLLDDFETISEGLPNFGSKEDYVDLLEKCLVVDYKERITIFDILEHPFFRDVPNEPNGMWRGLYKVKIQRDEFHILEKASNSEKRLNGLEVFDQVSVDYCNIAHRILFQGLDIYERCLLYCERNNIDVDEKILGYASIYLSSKYFLDESCPSMKTLFPKMKDIDDTFINNIIEMEEKILTQYLQWKIYRVTIYDLLKLKRKTQAMSLLFLFLKKKDKAYGHKIDKLADLFEKQINA